ncbi:hypothetical protein ARMGADRAFT_1048623 [Armillaria gallica]|uniref:CxC2-like cysteine cluster KDZ transposase-associated domain-containing protein n=1 Tax=Armillaria gallica TaxID=47427 RepID=A0A2H3D2A6_ARMGA|nr:hypothetical protein ARMGADRAFT_1048623 [Armillaria gallica]
MHEWFEGDTNPGFHKEFLAKFLRGEGRGSSPTDLCLTCQDLNEEKSWDTTPVIRCEEYGVGVLECIHCSMLRHQGMPLHRIKRWTGTFFELYTLKACGLRIQLGHWNGHCINPHAAPSDFTVLHVNGIHKVAVDFCACKLWVPDRIQCLHYGWFPATTHFPQTCATMAVLKHFHTQTLCGKVSMYEYYCGLIHLTDNTEINLPKFRHLLMMKWAGQGHIPDGIKTTKLGDLALGCIACPHPGKNLPEGWENEPQSEQ